jgi:hypothetical protein
MPRQLKSFGVGSHASCYNTPNRFAGGHTVPPFAAATIWQFFSQF